MYTLIAIEYLFAFIYIDRYEHCSDTSHERMTSLRRSLHTLSEDLRAFSEISNELNDLRRNVTIRTVTGVSEYRLCLDDLKQRVQECDTVVQKMSGVTVNDVPTMQV